MKNTMTRVLIIATVLMLALAYVVNDTDNGSDTRVAENIYPDLRDRLYSVDRVRITSNSDLVNIVRSEGVWRVEDRYGYVASFDMLSNFLNDLYKAKYLEKKTSKAEHHSKLGLTEPSAENSESRLVEVFVAEELVVELVLGKASSHLDGSYFRFPADDQAWLMDRHLEAVAQPAGWLDPLVINIAERDIVRVSQSSSNGDQISITRNEDSEQNFSPEIIPDGMQAKYPTVFNQLARSLVNLNLEDVRPAGSIDWTGSNRTEFVTSKDLRITVLSKQVEDHYYLGFTVNGLEAGDASGSDAARELADKLMPWVYEVSKTTYNDFAHTNDELFEDLTVEATQP